MMAPAASENCERPELEDALAGEDVGLLWPLSADARLPGPAAAAVLSALDPSDKRALRLASRGARAAVDAAAARLTAELWRVPPRTAAKYVEEPLLLARTLRRLPRLARLQLSEGAASAPGRLSALAPALAGLTTLRELDLSLQGAPAAALAPARALALGAAALLRAAGGLPALEALSLDIGFWGQELRLCRNAAPALRAFSAEPLPRLRALRLLETPPGAAAGAAAAAALAAAPWRAQLHTLEVTGYGGAPAPGVLVNLAAAINGGDGGSNTEEA
ncbi:MAG: hypothetical protein J3K34DRAFT_522641 [Monoraphidium minutum]|nr:MAG: hypothetical protein J3K34DRAFT_522641 [Monoraphidium minutum]